MITASQGLGWGSEGRQRLEKQSKGQSGRVVCEGLSEEVMFEQRHAGEENEVRDCRGVPDTGTASPEVSQCVGRGQGGQSGSEGTS